LYPAFFNLTTTNINCQVRPGTSKELLTNPAHPPVVTRSIPHIDLAKTLRKTSKWKTSKWKSLLNARQPDLPNAVKPIYHEPDAVYVDKELSAVGTSSTTVSNMAVMISLP
jgi:hypothetical protein